MTLLDVLTFLTRCTILAVLLTVAVVLAVDGYCALRAWRDRRESQRSYLTAMRRALTDESRKVKR